MSIWFVAAAVIGAARWCGSRADLIDDCEADGNSRVGGSRSTRSEPPLPLIVNASPLLGWELSGLRSESRRSYHVKVRTWRVGLAVLALGASPAFAETSGWSYDNNVSGVAFASDCCEPACDDPCCSDDVACGDGCAAGGLFSGCCVAGPIEGFSLAELMGLERRLGDRGRRLDEHRLLQQEHPAVAELRRPVVVRRHPRPREPCPAMVLHRQGRRRLGRA